MATNYFPSRTSFFLESTPGTPPSSSGVWVSSGRSIYTILQPDVSSFLQNMIEDERSREHVLREQPMIKGIKGLNEFGFETYMHGHEDTTLADTDQVAATNLSTLLLNCLGGEFRGTTSTASTSGAHSTTEVEVDDDTGMPIGSWVGLPDADGVIHHRRVTDNTSTPSGGGTVLTLHRALPFTPSDSDVIRGLLVLHVDESVLEDAVAQTTTTSWLMEMGRTEQRWLAMGCAANLSGITIARNEAAKLAFNVLVGSFRTPEENTDDSLAPSWSADPTGSAGAVVGPLTDVFIQDFGTATENCVHAASVEVTPNVTRTRVESTTECNTGMPGTATYGFTNESSPEMSVVVTPRADSYLDDFNAGTLQHVQFERRSATDGAGFSIYLPRAEIMATPANAQANDNDAYTLMFRGLRVDSATQRIASPIQIVLA